MSEKKYVQVGRLLKSKAGNEYISLGSEGNKNEKYDFEVQVMVKNAKGEKVALLKNPALFFSDPRREREDGSVPNIPEFILKNIGVTLGDE